MAGSKVLKPAAGVVILVGLYAAAGYIGVPAGVRWAVSNVVPDARRTIFLPLSICRPI